MEQAAEHNAGESVQGSLFYEGGHVSAKESTSLGSLVTSEREDYGKTEQVRCLYDGGELMQSRALFTAQESCKKPKMASENPQQELLLAPRFQYGLLEGGNPNVRSSVEGSSANVRSSLVVENSSKESSIFQRAHLFSSNPLHNAGTSTNNIPVALPLLSSSCKNDPPLLQDLPWFANHALEDEEVGGFPLVRPTGAFCSAPNSTSMSSFSPAFNAHARSSLISLLGETDAEHSILQAHIVAHPLFEQLLAAHLACLRMGTPPERWPDANTLDARLTLSRQELDAKYLLLARNAPPPHDKDNLDHFMLSFTLLLQTFREQLREHMQVHSVEASSGWAEIRDAFFRLTGQTSLTNMECTSTMSDDEDMTEDEVGEGSLHQNDPTNTQEESMCSPFNMAGEIDKSLMESIRKELKLELKQNYKSKLWDVREEIMRKRRAGKLPGSTTSFLKDWWDAHSQWPYPTEEEKMKLVQETGLELKQINNWFINQRKRNWNMNPVSERGDMDEFSLYGAFHPS